MKSGGHSSRPRAYDSSLRAEAAAETRRATIEAAIGLWREVSLDRITLQAVADRAGVTVQTVLRHFGSKNGLFEACIEGDASGIEEERARASAGAPHAALEVLLDHYERDGDATLRTLALEDRLPIASKVAERGRRQHRAWCRRVFGPWLPARRHSEHVTRLDGFVAATDIYLWKLLRRDLGRSRKATAQVFRRLADSLCEHARDQSSEDIRP